MVEELTGKELKRWNLSDYLKTPEDIHYYLEAAVAEDTGDGSMIRAALGDIAQVQERNMAHLAKAAGTTPEELYKALSTGGNPSFATVLKIARALDLRLLIEPSLHDDSAH